MTYFIGKLQYLIPQLWLSQLAGWLANRQHPQQLVHWVIKRFVAFYQVDLNEAILKQAEDYPSFNHFFTRELQADARPFTENAQHLLSPADGHISQCGAIIDQQLIQAKGHTYTLTDLLATPAINPDWTQFATIYLSPKDYHRIHSPMDMQLTQSTYIPGNLFAVNQTSVHSIDSLFARNERLICHFDTANGPIVLIFVGALIVGGIETVWQKNIKRQQKIVRQIHPSIPIKQGEEIGRFLLGSTIIMLLSDSINLTAKADSSIQVKHVMADCTK